MCMLQAQDKVTLLLAQKNIILFIYLEVLVHSWRRDSAVLISAASQFSAVRIACHDLLVL